MNPAHIDDTCWSRRNVLAMLGCTVAGWSARARAAPTGITLQGSRRAAALDFKLIDNRLFVAATINGMGPYQLVFDSGGANILDSAVARALGLPLRDEFAMPGAGETTLPAWRTRVDEARLGSITMREMPFVVMPLQTIRRAIGFDRLDGLVGHELLQRFVVRMDFDAARLHFHEPDAAPAPPADAQRLAIDFAGTVPRIRATVDGRAATLAIDTGDRSSLTLFTPFVDEHALRGAYPKQVRHITGWGVGGPLLADVTRVGNLALGTIELRDVVTRMPLSRAGVFASRLASGSIGTGVLKRLNAVFDYSRSSAWLGARGSAGGPDPADRSGMWLVRADGDGADIEVFHVVDNSPAQRAGLARGDRIVSVGGQAASSVSLTQLRDRLASDPVGTAVSLTLKGGRQVKLVLDDLF